MQAVQRLAHRRFADAEPFREKVLRQPRFFIEVCLKDVALDAFVGKCREVLRKAQLSMVAIDA